MNGEREEERTRGTRRAAGVSIKMVKYVRTHNSDTEDVRFPASDGAEIEDRGEMVVHAAAGIKTLNA